VTTARSAGPPDTPAQPATATPGAATPFIASLAVDPGNGTLIIGTGLGLYRLEPGAAEAARAGGTLTTGSGSAPVSANLVVSFVAPGTLVASGHPQGDSSLPEDLGLIRSEDGGETWRSVSLLGEADLHALDVRGDRIAGLPADAQRLLVSRDGGRSFAERTPPGVPVDVDLDPAGADRLAITTADGVYVSENDGGAWRQRDTLSTKALLAWAESGSLYRVEANGSVRVSEDEGGSWQQRGNAGGPPTAATVDADGALYVALAGAVIVRSQDGRGTFERVVQLRS
jgi:hypothetical protein